MDQKRPIDWSQILWRPQANPATVVVGTAPAGYDPTPLDLMALRHSAQDVASHAILHDPHGDLRLWLPDTEAVDRPAVILPLDEAFELRLDMTRRFHRRMHGHPAGPLPRALQITPMRRARLILLLHTLDFHLTGASRRTIAAALLDSGEAALPAIEWKSSATRRKTNRLVSDAIALMRGGYRRLLRGD